MNRHSRIVEYAREHASILADIRQLDYAPAALRDNESILSNLKQRIDEHEKILAQLQKKTKKENKDLTKLQNSAGRRLIVRLKHGGKKEAVGKRLEKEEKEYMEALDAQFGQESVMGALKDERTELEGAGAELRAKARKHHELKTRLQTLYDAVFEGYTPDYPLEDAAEVQLKQAEELHSNAQSSVNKESQALSLLSNAHRALLACIDHLSIAQGWNYNDMFGGGLFSEMLENNALMDAKAQASRGEALVNQARAIQPKIGPMGRPDVAQFDFLMNVVFDNVFTDILFAQRIQASLSSVSVAAEHVRAEILQGNNRIQEVTDSLHSAQDYMYSQRKHLEDIRRNILESVASGLPQDKSLGFDLEAEGVADMEAPPPYSQVSVSVQKRLDNISNFSEHSREALLRPNIAVIRRQPSPRQESIHNPYADILLQRAGYVDPQGTGASRMLNANSGVTRMTSQLLQDRSMVLEPYDVDNRI